MKKLVIKDYQSLEERLRSADKFISEQEILIALGMNDSYQVRYAFFFEDSGFYYVNFLFHLAHQLGHFRHVFLDVFVEGFLSLLGRLGQLDARTHHFRQPFVLLGIELQ